MRTLVGLLLVVLGGVLGLLAMLMARRSKSESGWPCVTGRVTASSVVRTVDGYMPSVTYEYTHSGALHRGTKIRSAALEFNWAAPAERDVAKYAIDKDVQVFLDPENPSESVLEPGSTSGYRFVSTFSCLALAAGVAILAT